MGFKGVFIARTCFPDENECDVKIPNNDVDIIDCVFQELNLAVVGSQIVGLVPLQALMETADYYMNKSNLFILEEDQKLRLVSELNFNLLKILLCKKFFFSCQQC